MGSLLCCSDDSLAVEGDYLAVWMIPLQPEVIPLLSG